MRRNKQMLRTMLQVILWTASTVAAEPDARQLYEQGSEAYRAAHYEEAIELLGRAARLEPHAELAYDLGRAYEGAGDLGRAIDSFREYLRLAPGLGDRAAVEERIASLTTRLETTRAQVVVATHPDDATLSIDGQVAGTTPWKGALTAGVHHVALRRAGSLDLERDLVVVQGQKLVLYLELDAVSPAMLLPPPAEHDSVLHRVRLPTWLALGAGAGAFAAAAAFQVAEQSAESDARRAPTQLEHRAHYASAETDRDVSRVFVGVGALALVTGATLLTIDLTRRKPASRPRTAVELRLQLGVLGNNVEGRF